MPGWRLDGAVRNDRHGPVFAPTGGRMPATRLMPTQESDDLIELTRDIVDKELRPLADEAERAHAFHREVFRTLGRAGLLSLPYPQELGGGGQPYEVYLQVL